MSFSPLNDMDKLKQILAWDGTRKANFSVEGASDWTDEELRNKADLSDEDIAKFRKNLIDCQKDAKERKAENADAALIIASSRVSSYKDAFFVYNPATGLYETGNKAMQRLMYEALGSAKANRWDFIEFDPRSMRRIVKSLKTNYIRVGSRYFDVVKGEMVDEVPEEFRTFRIIQDVTYTPVNFDDCHSTLVTDLKKHLGAENLKYVLLSVAYNLTDIRVDKRALVIVGEIRTGKGTLIKALKMIGLAADVNLKGDFESGNRFCDQLGNVAPIYAVISADECGDLDWDFVKVYCSDETINVEPKGEKKFTAATRALPIITMNSAPRSVSDGIVNKLCIMQTEQSFKDNIDPDYFKKIEAENGFEELINLILTLAHKLTVPPERMPEGKQWNPSLMPKLVEKKNDELLKDFIYHDQFISKWDRDETKWTSVKDSYAAYLHYANPDVDFGLIKLKVDELVNTPKSQPEGLAGRSLQNFSSDMKLAGIKGKMKRVLVKSGEKVEEKVVRGFVGKPYFEPDLDPEADLSKFC